jgi:hypothetical protein
MLGRPVADVWATTRLSTRQKVGDHLKLEKVSFREDDPIESSRRPRRLYAAAFRLAILL